MSYRKEFLLESWYKKCKHQTIERLLLARFHYAAIGIFGKTAVHKSLKASFAYLQEAHVQ